MNCSYGHWISPLARRWQMKREFRGKNNPTYLSGNEAREGDREDANKKQEKGEGCVRSAK